MSKTAPGEYTIWINDQMHSFTVDDKGQGIPQDLTGIFSTTPAVPMDGGREAPWGDGGFDPASEIAAKLMADGWLSTGSVDGDCWRYGRIQEIADPIIKAALTPSSADAGAGLRDEIKRIAGDYHPDRDQDAPLALSEMREALFAALAAIPEGAGSVGGELTGLNWQISDKTLAEIREIDEAISTAGSRIAALSAPPAQADKPPFSEVQRAIEERNRIDPDHDARVVDYAAIEAMEEEPAPPAQAETAGEDAFADQLDAYEKAIMAQMHAHYGLTSYGEPASLARDVVDVRCNLIATHRHAAHAGAGDGFVLVPREPTKAMKLAAFGPIMEGGRGGPITADRIRQEAALSVYRKMIEAAPIGTGNGEASGS